MNRMMIIYLRIIHPQLIFSSSLITTCHPAVLSCYSSDDGRGQISLFNILVNKIDLCLTCDMSLINLIILPVKEIR